MARPSKRQRQRDRFWARGGLPVGASQPVVRPARCWCGYAEGDLFLVEIVDEGAIVLCRSHLVKLWATTSAVLGEFKGSLKLHNIPARQGISEG